MGPPTFKGGRSKSGNEERWVGWIPVKVHTTEPVVSVDQKQRPRPTKVEHNRLWLT
jgi:hypothetical protein